jgi:hypothetical protein
LCSIGGGLGIDYHHAEAGTSLPSPDDLAQALHVLPDYQVASSQPPTRTMQMNFSRLRVFIENTIFIFLLTVSYLILLFFFVQYFLLDILAELRVAQNCCQLSLLPHGMQVC